MQKVKGFTLLEMMIVVAILGIISTIAIPSMNNYMDSRRAVSAAEAIYSQLVYARSEAIARSRDVVARVTPVADGGPADGTWELGVSTNEDCITKDVTLTDPTDACVLKVSGVDVLKRIAGTDHPGVAVSIAGVDAGETHTFKFDPVRGTATGNNTVTVTFKGYELKIYVALIGRVRMCSPTKTGNYAQC